MSSRLLLCLFPDLFPAVRGGYRRCGLGLCQAYSESFEDLSRRPCGRGVGRSGLG